jgi:polyribonucleotide nucleotidyltransferase
MTDGLALHHTHNSKKVHTETVQVGSATLCLDTGRIAKQASGSVWVQYGDSVVLSTAVSAPAVREGIDFLPLTVEYQEKTYAAGRIPGGFFKREGRPRDYETLCARITDRSIRPLFPEGYRFEVQVVSTVLSHDGVHETDAMSLVGASAALHISDIPWSGNTGPIAAVRVGRVEGKFVVNPGPAEKLLSDLDLFVAAHKDAIVMVEGGANEVPEDVVIDALLFGHRSCLPIIEAIERLRAAMGKPKAAFTPPVVNPELVAAVESEALAMGLKDAFGIREKLARYGRRGEIEKAVKLKLAERFPAQEKVISAIFHDLEWTVMRAMITDDGKRLDGRAYTEVRPIDIEVGVLPRAHGSAVFTRGETQALVSVTLGTKDDEQKLDTLQGEFWRKFMLHYNFPPFSVGEAKPMRSAGRREIGHGALAERAILKVIPENNADFPYTLRVVSEILESNGSSSMASVCGATMALMDGGVPLKAPCAGIAMGLIKDGAKVAVLTDILGDEDHLGDMDFKVCGTETGITAVQMDIKIDGMSREILEKALYQARDGRKHILKCMTEVLPKARPEISRYAPRIQVIRVSVDRIKDVIGPGGKVIRDIVEKTKCKIDIADTGDITIASPDVEGIERAIQIIKDLTQDAEPGRIYQGTVTKVADFGAFVQIFPGTDGLVHISELSDKRVEHVTDVVQEGDELLVKCLSIEPGTGKIRLSRKQAAGHAVGEVIPVEPGTEEAPRRSREGRGDRDHRGGGRGDRGRRS